MHSIIHLTGCCAHSTHLLAWASATQMDLPVVAHSYPKTGQRAEKCLCAAIKTKPNINGHIAIKKTKLLQHLAIAGNNYAKKPPFCQNNNIAT